MSELPLSSLSPDRGCGLHEKVTSPWTRTGCESRDTPGPFASPPPPPPKRKQLTTFLSTFTLKPRPGSSLDRPICSEFARQQSRRGGRTSHTLGPSLSRPSHPPKKEQLMTIQGLSSESQDQNLAFHLKAKARIWPTVLFVPNWRGGRTRDTLGPCLFRPPPPPLLHRVYGFGFRVSGFGFRVSGVGFRV